MYIHLPPVVTNFKQNFLVFNTRLELHPHSGQKLLKERAEVVKIRYLQEQHKKLFKLWCPMCHSHTLSKSTMNWWKYMFDHNKLARNNCFLSHIFQRQCSKYLDQIQGPNYWMIRQFERYEAHFNIILDTYFIFSLSFKDDLSFLQIVACG